MVRRKGVSTDAGSKSEVLAKVKGYFEAGIRHPAYVQWMEEAAEAWRFYDGAQWSASEKSALAEKGQPAIVINKIASKIDNIAGGEVIGRTRMILRSRSGEQQEEASARALSDLMLYVSERSGQALEVSSMFKAGLVSGIGWLDVGVETDEEGPRIFSRAEDETQVVFDADAQRADLSDARFVARSRWLDGEEIKGMFPRQASAVMQQNSGFNDTVGSYRDALLQEQVTYADTKRNLMRVVEVQYKMSEKFYAVRRADGTRFSTFSKVVAEAEAMGGELESSYKPRVYVAYYSGNILLEHKALGYQFNRFTLVPYVFKRERLSGVPYGMLRAAIDPQRELNKRRSKAMHLLNTAQVIADVDAVDDPKILAREAARPDGVILKRPGKDLRIIRNSDLAQSQVAVMSEAARDIQDVLGVYDEAVGKTSNATSGVAIQQRQVAGSLNQMFAFDALRKVKKSLGEMMLTLIRQYFTHEMVIHITDQLGAARVVRLNEIAKDADGNVLTDDTGETIKLLDVKAGIFDVHVEEVRDATSGRELELQQLAMLRDAGVPVPPAMLVEATNLRGKDEILDQLQEG